MARAALQRGVGPAWRTARLVEAHAETGAARTLRFDVPDWPGHLPGQHVDLRLTAQDGYVARRSYSLSAPADGSAVELTVQLVDDGEVSPYLVRDLEPGDEVELLGPLGGWFVWRPDQPEPVLLVGGGSGVAPLVAMRRSWVRAGAATPMRLLYSVRSPAQVYFAPELLGAPDGSVVLLYTRDAPPDDPRGAHRIDARDVAAHAWPADRQPTCYVCGPTSFVESTISLLLAAGHDPARIRAERFGGG